VTVKMPHGHPQGWAPKEIGIFVDQHLNKGEPFPPALILGDHQPAGEQIEVTASADDPKGTLVSGQVHWATDLKLPWQKREWQSVEATVKAPGQLTAKLPKGTGLVYFFTAKDRRGATVSSEHTEVGK
jgi:hypothetical protein